MRTQPCTFCALDDKENSFSQHLCSNGQVLLPDNSLEWLQLNQAYSYPKEQENIIAPVLAKFVRCLKSGAIKIEELNY